MKGLGGGRVPVNRGRRCVRVTLSKARRSIVNAPPSPCSPVPLFTVPCSRVGGWEGDGSFSPNHGRKCEFSEFGKAVFGEGCRQVDRMQSFGTKSHAVVTISEDSVRLTFGKLAFCGTAEEKPSLARRRVNGNSCARLPARPPSRVRWSRVSTGCQAVACWQSHGNTAWAYSYPKESRLC